MNRHALSLALLALTAALPLRASLIGGPGDDADPAAKTLASMGWLAGTWTGDVWGGRYVSHYSTPEGGKIISHSRLTHDGELSFYEFEVFEVQEEHVHLQPYPGGKPADGFRLNTEASGERTAVFENPDKDYPTRITYERLSEDELLIVLDDPHGESDKVDRFELERPAD